jgi:hypothetical protein
MANIDDKEYQEYLEFKKWQGIKTNTSQKQKNSAIGNDALKEQDDFWHSLPVKISIGIVIICCIFALAGFIYNFAEYKINYNASYDYYSIISRKQTTFTVFLWCLIPACATSIIPLIAYIIVPITKSVNKNT